MAERRFLHITFDFAGPPKIKELESVFNQAKDWLRYAPNCWIVWTTSTPKQWCDRLKPKLGEKDSILVHRFDMEDYYGWMPEWIWDWFKKKR